MPSKPRVWSGFIVRPAYQVTHELNLRRTDSGNPSRANERSGVEDRCSGFFSESDSIHLDSFITWRNQMQMRGCVSGRWVKTIVLIRPNRSAIGTAIRYETAEQTPLQNRIAAVVVTETWKV